MKRTFEKIQSILSVRDHLLDEYPTMAATEYVAKALTVSWLILYLYWQGAHWSSSESDVNYFFSRRMEASYGYFLEASFLL